MSTQPDAVLFVEKGITDVSVVPLGQDACVLGKSPAADVPVDNPYVSRQHAEIIWEKGSYFIRDLGSKNGSFVNGDPVQGEGWQLYSGDRIELGRRQVVFRFQQRGSTLTLPPIHQAATGDLEVESKSREVRIKGHKLDPPFSRKEFDVLSLLYQRKGEACSKDEIAQSGWPERAAGDVGDQDIEQYIRRIRLRIEPDPSNPQYLLTVRGYGYKLSQE